MSDMTLFESYTLITLSLVIIILTCLIKCTFDIIDLNTNVMKV